MSKKNGDEKEEFYMYADSDSFRERDDEGLPNGGVAALRRVLCDPEGSDAIWMNMNRHHM